MELNTKLVDYNKYCPLCEYKNLEDYRDPCNDCLNNPVNWNSRKPIRFKEKEDAKTNDRTKKRDA